MTHRTAAADGALMGMKEICRYMGKSEPTIIRYIRVMGFPANKVSGVWVSDTELIKAWRHGLITRKKAKKK
ncbi:hypothetical protein LJB86_02740 [Deltaproteobacteria bacterium OttesenSCG-928-M10]|nr:hypothetical protein [Deltaproteobacteria bacterium OttesenSCG-928-M10]